MIAWILLHWVQLVQSILPPWIVAVVYVMIRHDPDDCPRGWAYFLVFTVVCAVVTFIGAIYTSIWS